MLRDRTASKQPKTLELISNWLFRVGYCITSVLITVVASAIYDFIRIGQRWMIILSFIIFLVPLTQYVIFIKRPNILTEFTNILPKLTLREFLLLAIIEEATFRMGLLYYVLLPRMDELTAIFLSSAIFGVYHFDRYFLFSAYRILRRIIVALVTIVAAFTLGLLFAWVFMRLASLPIVAFLTVSSLHGMYNFVVMQKAKKASVSLIA